MFRNRFIAISFSTFVVFAAVSFSASGHGLSGAVSKVNKATATHRVKPTATPSQTPQALIKSSPSATHPATPTPIDTPVEIATGDTTEAFSPTPTYTDTPTSTATPTSTPTVPMLERKGVARYQNHKSDAGILISVVDASNKVLSSTATDTKGRYTVMVPADSSYSLIFSAPLHLTAKIALRPKVVLPAVKLRGGDLNQDGCIGSKDLSLLTASFGSTDAADITGDGIVDVHDLAILVGNLNTHCTPTVTANSNNTGEANVSVAPDAIPTSTQIPPSTPTPKPPAKRPTRIPTVPVHK